MTTLAPTSTTAEQLRARRRTRGLLGKVLTYGLLSLIAVITVYPFYWTVLTSLETTGAIYTPKLLPSGFTWRNYAAVFENAPMLRWVLNSVIICFFGVVGSVVLATLAAYPLARMRFPGRDLIFYAILAVLVLPNEAGLIVNYITTVKLGLLRSVPGEYAAIVLPGLASVVGLFLLRQAYLGIPQELIEAARIDGASELTIWRRVMIPLALPTITAFAILDFVATWNSFLWARIILNDREMYPLAAGLLELNGLFSTNTRAVAAGTVLTIIPILLLFLFAQRYFMRGIEGAVKG